MSGRQRPFLPAVVGPWASYVIVRELERELASMAANYSALESTRVIGRELELALESMREAGRQRFEAYQAAASADGSAELPQSPSVQRSEVPPWWAGVSTSEAAGRLGLSERQICNLIGTKLSAAKQGRAWLIDEASLAVELERRQEAERQRT